MILKYLDDSSKFIFPYNTLRVLLSVYRIWAIRQTSCRPSTLTSRVCLLIFLQGVFSCVCSIYLISSGCYAYFNPKDLLCWPSIGIVADHKQTFVSYYTVLFIAVPMVVTTVINISIPVYVKCNTIRDNSQAMKRMILTLSAVVWVFLGSYVCVIVNLILGFLHTFERQQAAWFDLIMVYFMSLNVIMNPMIYVLTNTRFRQFLLNRLCRGNMIVSSQDSASRNTRF